MEKEVKHNIYCPPLDLWLKISKLILLIDRLTQVDLKLSAGKAWDSDLKDVRDTLTDPGIKEWLSGIRQLKEQNVLKK